MNVCDEDLSLTKSTRFTYAATKVNNRLSCWSGRLLEWMGWVDCDLLSPMDLWARSWFSQEVNHYLQYPSVTNT